MDFIEGFLKVRGKSMILTVVDRFSKFVHFITFVHSYSAPLVAKAFFEGIVATWLSVLNCQWQGLGVY
jgi:GTP:adenosylcobinamide-phosphate guanylyltransferase